MEEVALTVDLHTLQSPPTYENKIAQNEESECMQSVGHATGKTTEGSTQALYAVPCHAHAYIQKINTTHTTKINDKKKMYIT